MSGAGASERAGLGLLVVLAAAVLGFLVWRVAQTAPGLDEYATMWFSDPSVTLGSVYATRWAGETNPPLYYAGVRLVRLFTNPGIEELRLIHVIPYFGVSAYLLAVAVRCQRHRVYAAVLAALYVSSGTTSHFFPELRSYFLQFSLLTVASAALVFLRSGELPGRAAHWAVLVVSLLVVFNLHFTAGLLAGLLAVAAILEALRRGDRRFAASLFAVCCIGVLPTVAFILVNFTTLAGRARDFWITTTPGEALEYMAIVVRGVPSRNVVLLLAVVGGLAWFRERFVAVLEERGYASSVAVQAAASVLFLVLLFAANAAKPILITKYLLAVGAPLMSVLALLSVPVLERWRWMLLGVAANAAFAAYPLALRPQIGPLQAQSDRAVVAGLAASCPGTAVYGLWQQAESTGVYELMYRIDADLLGLNLRPRLTDITWTPILDAHCPTILWATHALERQTVHDAAGFARLFLLSLPDNVLKAARLTITNELGLILVLPPAP